MNTDLTFQAVRFMRAVTVFVFAHYILLNCWHGDVQLFSALDPLSFKEMNWGDNCFKDTQYLPEHSNFILKQSLCGV